MFLNNYPLKFNYSDNSNFGGLCDFISNKSEEKVLMELIKENYSNDLLSHLMRVFEENI